MLIPVMLLLSAAISLGLCAGTRAFSDLGWLWQLPLEFLGSFLLMMALNVVFLMIVCSKVDLSRPQEKDDPFFRFLISLYTPAIMTLLQARIKTQNLDRIPKDGRFLLVCNHFHLLDPVMILSQLPRAQLAFISKREVSQMFLVGKLMHRILCQPINRENDREALKTILNCISIIKEDKASIAVFPEGYTSRDAKLHHFRNGVFKIAQKAKVPIVVCTLTGTQNLFHNAMRLRATPVTFHVADVIPPQDLEGVHTNEIGDRVYSLMAQDLGRDNVAED